MADWYYNANGQQAGPVDVQTLRQMIGSGALSQAELVYGPGLTQWTPAGQVPALSVGGVQGDTYQSPAAAAPMMGYRGVETDTGIAGLSGPAMNALRGTKPWVRFISIMSFIGVGFMVLGGLAVLFAGTMSNGRSGAIPSWLGLIYLVLAAVYVIPAVLLTRYANAIGTLMRTRRMSDVEQSLDAQKAFWKFTGIMIIAVICIYILAIVAVVVFSVMRL